MKIYLIFGLILILDFSSYSQQEESELLTSNANGEKLFVGEDLTYVVKYAFFNLGEVRIKVLGKTKINNTTVYETIAYIDSYPDLPFVSLHQVYESYIDSSLFPLKFFSEIFDDDTIFVRYNFIDSSKVEMQKGKLGAKNLWLDSTANIHHRVQDGLSILFYVRMIFDNKKTLSVPCFVNEKEEEAVLNFYNEPTPVSIDAVDHEIDCRYLDGYTDFVSVYGLTGSFEGWFSNDKFSVPILAKMNVLIGSINLELIRWNAELWNPPLFKN
ncbi:MAG TPA: DUF3108 domain-containing protein [Ignavibacteriaceae bacterium]